MPAARHKPVFPGEYFAVDGHDLHFVSTPEDRLQAVLGVIAVARSNLRMLIYMFRDDESGQQVMDALLDACGRGVTVKLMIDGFGSHDTSNGFFNALIDAGGQFHTFSSRWNLGYFVRNHQKILIADQEHVLISGYNMTDHYFGRAGDDSWDDFGVVLSGPKANDLVVYYDDLVELTGDGGIRFGKLRQLIGAWQTGNGGLRWLLGGPTNRISPWALSLKHDLEEAKRFHLASAYFSPTQSILRRIAKTRSILVLAGKTDNGATIAAARTLYKYLLKRGARIFEYQRQPLHKKLLVIDNASYVGSANLDVRSLFINMEIMLRIEDPDVADYLREHIECMFADCQEQTLPSHRKRNGIFNKIRNFLAYLLVNSIDYTIGRRIRFRRLRSRSSGQKTIEKN